MLRIFMWNEERKGEDEFFPVSLYLLNGGNLQKKMWLMVFLHLSRWMSLVLTVNLCKNFMTVILQDTIPRKKWGRWVINPY